MAAEAESQGRRSPVPTPVQETHSRRALRRRPPLSPVGLLHTQKGGGGGKGAWAGNQNLQWAESCVVSCYGDILLKRKLSRVLIGNFYRHFSFLQFTGRVCVQILVFSHNVLYIDILKLLYFKIVCMLIHRQG